MMTEVPLIVTEEAAAHVAKLGLQLALEQNLDWVRQNVDDLYGIHVKLSVVPRDRTLVVIEPHHRPPGKRPYPLDLWDWLDWRMKALPFEVGCAFLLCPAYQPMPSKSA
jgi:hypothetical protein